MKICPSCQSTYNADETRTCPHDGSPLSRLFEEGEVVRQKYRIMGQIGRGGMGTVYRARHLIWNEDRAIKILLQPRGQAFLAEAQVMRRLQHRHIVRVEDTDFTEDGQPFVVMEYIDGEDLKRRLHRTGPFDPEEALRIAAQTCSALAAAHGAGVTHRDIKPQNLLLARDADGSEVVKVIDFGLAKVREESGLGFTGVIDSSTGYSPCTPAYASPEQANGVRGSQLDGRSDLYSLGLVLYELLTGTLPFRGDTPMAVLVQRLQKPPQSLQEVKADLPTAVCEVVMRALQLERGDRYASATEMQAACEGALARIQWDREEPIRRELEAREAQISAGQKQQERKERRREAIERLRAAARSPSVLLRKLLVRRIVVAAAIVFAVMAVIGLGVFAYSFGEYSRLVDAGFNADIVTGLFGAPETLGLGDITAPVRIAAGLRRSGYSESRNNPIGYFQIQADAIAIFPGPLSYFDAEAASIKFAGGKVSQIVSLSDNTARTQYGLEPQLLTNLTDASREKRRKVQFSNIPPVLVHGVTSAEDKHFFQHAGFNPIGGLTITQKLVTVLWAPKSFWSRAMLTLQVERKLPKERIFEEYCNRVYLGSRGSFRIRGFGEAAEVFLGKDLTQITLPEAAELAGIPQSPATFDPFRHPDRLVERRNVVLGLMRSNGYITDRDYASAVGTPMAKNEGAAHSLEAPYFADLVNQTLQEKFQDQDLQSNAFRVYTTLDTRLQRAAAEAVRMGMLTVDDQIRRQNRFQGQTPPEPQVALVAIDPHTGAIKALVGGRNYGTSQINHALGKRQPSSIFKPFVYAAAMKTGLGGGPVILTPSTIVPDEPTTIVFDGQSYEFANSENTFRGNVTLREALAHSLDIPAVKVAGMVGYNQVAELANRAGMNYKSLPIPTIALGTYEITPLEAAGGYTMFANRGVSVRPSWLTLVRSPDGKVLYKEKQEQKPVLDPRVSYLITSLMEEALRSGSASDLRAIYGFNVPAAGATGLSRDGWFAGYTSELLCIVWVGFDGTRALELDGAHSAGPIWMEFMKRALEYRGYRDAKPFAVPDGIVSIDIDPQSGMPANSACPSTRMEVYIAGTQPVGSCPLHRGAGQGTVRVPGWDVPAPKKPSVLPGPAPKQAQSDAKNGLQNRMKESSKKK